MTTVTALRVAPVKALAAVRPAQVVLQRDGAAEDRRLFLLDADGAVVTLRRHPRLARVVPALDLAAGTLAVALPDGSAATTDLAAAAEPVTARLFGKDRDGRVVPGPVAEAISDYLGHPVRLVLAARTGVGWDEGPVSLAGRASVAAVGAPGAEPGDRFRMLLEVDGTAPFEEDTWVGRRVRAGGAVLRVEFPLVRCVVIESDPATGDQDWAGLKALAAARGRALTLGVIAAVDAPGTVRVGDAVEVVGPG